MSRLAWEVRHGATFAGLRQQARDAAMSAIRKAGEDASPKDLAAVAMQAVETSQQELDWAFENRRTSYSFADDAAGKRTGPGELLRCIGAAPAFADRLERFQQNCRLRLNGGGSQDWLPHGGLA